MNLRIEEDLIEKIESRLMLAAFYQQTVKRIDLDDFEWGQFLDQVPRLVKEGTLTFYHNMSGAVYHYKGILVVKR